MPRGAWEDVAEHWAEHVRSGGDAPFEWNFPAFRALLPPPGRATLDAGCGEGRVARALEAVGHRVIGVDSSATLVRLAREADPAGDYRVGDVTDLPLEDASVDLVVSFMVLQDVEDHEGAIAEAARVLAAGGRLCFAIIHPVASAGDIDDAGQLTLASYCNAFTIEQPLYGETVTQYHRPLAEYMQPLESAGFLVETLREVPTKRKAPGRHPMFLHVRALKP